MRLKQTPLKKDILLLKGDLLELEKRFNDYAAEIEKREQRWKNCEKKMEDLQRINEGTCTLSIGGKKFVVSLHTLKSRRGTIFYKQILRKEINKGSTTFYDRDPTYFPIILNFLRSGKLKYDKLDEEQKEDLLNEAQFYEVNYIIETLKATPGDVEFSSFESSGKFQYNGADVGTNNIKDLKDKTLTKGIVSNSPGTITITLSREVEIEEIDVAGYNGNSVAWFVGNGRGSNIQTSKDNKSWTQVGALNNEFGANIQTVKLTKSRAKYIRFTHNDYIGIGYLDVKEIVKKK
jgi:hypothetical protein